MIPAGWMIVGSLVLAVSAWLAVTRDRRLVSALFWLLVWGVVWTGFSQPLYRTPKVSEPAVRTGGTLIVVAGLAAVLGGFVLVEGVSITRSRWRCAREDPDGLLAPYDPWPGFRKSAGALSVLLILLLCFELALSVSADGVSAWVRPVVLAGSAWTAGAATFFLVGRRWSVNLAEAAMGLMTLGAASLPLLLVPSEPAGADARFPMVFNALIVGFGFAAGFWVWIGRVWSQQLDHGAPWTAAGRLSSVCPGFAFFVATLGLVHASLLAIWPRLRPVGVFDDSLGRLAAAVSGHLLLLLVALWSWRASRRASFGLLAVLVGLSTAVCVLVRAEPLVSSVHRGPSAEAGSFEIIRWVNV